MTTPFKIITSKEDFSLHTEKCSGVEYTLLANELYTPTVSGVIKRTRQKYAKISSGY